MLQNIQTMINLTNFLDILEILKLEMVIILHLKNDEDNVSTFNKRDYLLNIPTYKLYDLAKHYKIIKYKKDYVNTGVQNIWDICNIPKGSFYYYFKSKDDLLLHVIEYHRDNILELSEKTIDDLSIIINNIKNCIIIQIINNIIIKNIFSSYTPLLMNLKS